MEHEHDAPPTCAPHPQAQPHTTWTSRVLSDPVPVRSDRAPARARAREPAPGTAVGHTAARRCVLSSKRSKQKLSRVFARLERLSARLRHEGVVGILLDRSSAAAGKTHDKTNENPKLNPYVLGVSLLCGTFRKEYGKKSALAAPNPCRNDVFDVAFVSESGNSCMQIADCGHDPRFV